MERYSDIMSKLAQIAEALLDPSPLGFFIAIIVVIAIPIVLHNILAGDSSENVLPSILLLGPIGSGKTSLQTLFERGQNATTHTSQTPLAVECSLPVGTVAASAKYRSINDPSRRAHKFLLVDTPGHAKLRHHALSNGLGTKNLKGIIFIVDAANLSAGDDGLRQAAEFLHDALLLLQKRLTHSKTSKAPRKMHVLIAANKMDLFTAMPAAIVKATLEKEIGKIRSSKSKGLLESQVGAGDAVDVEESDDWLGESGNQQFAFEQMAEFNVSVEVAAGSIVGEDGADVKKWWNWVGGRL